jgi:hypothetical protein
VEVIAQRTWLTPRCDLLGGVDVMFWWALLKPKKVRCGIE